MLGLAGEAKADVVKANIETSERKRTIFLIVVMVEDVQEIWLDPVGAIFISYSLTSFPKQYVIHSVADANFC